MHTASLHACPTYNYLTSLASHFPRDSLHRAKFWLVLVLLVTIGCLLDEVLSSEANSGNMVLSIDDTSTEEFHAP